MLLVFRFTSNQRGIRKVKNKIKAHFLELRLFKDSLALMFKAQGNILRNNMKYIFYTGKPLLIMIIPLFLTLSQLNLWFGYQPLKPGEVTIVKVKLKKDQNPLNVNITIDPTQALAVETPPLRIEEEGEVSWRIRVKEKGLQTLTFKINGQNFSKIVEADQKPLTKISAFKVHRNFIDELYRPGEPPLTKDLPVRTVEIKYPSKGMNLFGWHIHWIIVYFVLSIIFGFAFKGVFKVEI